MLYIATDLRGIMSGAFQSRRIMLKRLLPLTCVVLLCLLTISSVSAQKSTATPDPDPTMTTSYQQVVVYAGPGITYQQNNLLNPGIPAQIVERNAVGTWLHLQRVADGNMVMDGWVLARFLNLNPALKFSTVTVNTDLADADPSTVNSQSLQKLYGAPVLPTISNTMRDVFQHGQELGNDPRAMTKLGDSLVANELYLLPMSQPDVDLGPYDYLSDTVKYFGPSARESMAARVGLTTYVIFDPLWANKDFCQVGESPLDCELRRQKPSVAFIMFGPNDLKAMDSKQYGKNMRKIVSTLLDKGVIPVLFMFSYDPDRPLWPQSLEFNGQLIDIGAEYSVPVVNLWEATRVLPEYGLEVDHLHLKNAGVLNLKFSKDQVGESGVMLYNLLSVCVLDDIRRTIIQSQ
ncbi:MAG: SGNH/GDSL hydrolase family protein [Chloroflexota bacterium]